MAQKVPKSNDELIIYRLNDIDTKLANLDKKVDHNFVNKDTYTVEMRAVKDDVRYLKNLVYGAVATFIGLAITAIAAGDLIK
jgi:tetrahydromethanopterin S-methyltransferase subunit B